MPLISPLAIQEALRPLTLVSQNQSPSGTGNLDKQNLRDLLAANGLTPDEIFDTIRSVMAGGEGPQRLQAAKLAAEISGLLESENVKPIPVINIIIKDSPQTFNPIFYPRESSLSDLCIASEPFDTQFSGDSHFESVSE